MSCDDNISVALSIGIGRLHFISTARFLAQAGCRIKLICGWIPRSPNSMLVRLFSKFCKADLAKCLKARMIDLPGVDVCSIPMVDFVDQMLRLVNRRLFKSRFVGSVLSLSWRFFGWKSRKYLTQTQIFHCRSGAGQGGAIVHAKAMGMKVVVDHSIAHPAFMDRQLRNDYEKNGMSFDLGMDSAFWRQIVKDCEDADLVMVNSYFVKDTFIEEGFPSEKIMVAYLGVRRDFCGLRKLRLQTMGVVAGKSNYMEDKHPLRLLFTGGFVLRKGAEYILEALKILKNHGVSFQMNVIGGYYDSLPLISRYANDLEITFISSQTFSTSQMNPAFRINFYGPMLQDELKPFLADNDIYVFPSLAEGCAQSGMEAMAAGMCVIGTHESGLPISEGENGFLVPSKNAEAIADKIEWLNVNRSDINRIGMAASATIQSEYTWEQYAKNTMKVYAKALSMG